MSVAANIRRLREEREWTQEELASVVGLSPYYVRQLESGTMNPTVRTLARLAATLEVDIVTLVQPAKLPQRKPGRPPKSRAE